MADQKNRGGKKQHNEKQELGKKRQGNQIEARTGGSQRGRQGIQRDQKLPGGRRSGNE